MITHVNNHCLTEIAKKTVGQVQSFLGDIVNETQNYRSLYNLTEQMTHDYSNRFIIELLQNGYDAIKTNRMPDGTPEQGKVKIVLEEREHSPSVLYFANSGAPISSSNFIALSSLALSDKSPSDSVGNKGIGFKSVLQVCTTPQIYSGYWSDEHGFDGHCFEFNPDKVELLSEKVIHMIEDNQAPDLSEIFGVPIHLKDWSQDRISQLKRRVGLLAGATGSMRQFLYSEMNYLSPYALPFPLSGGNYSEILRQLGKDGFVTVIRLELNKPDALELAKQALTELNENSWLFLDSISQLEIEHIGEIDYDLSRTMSKSETILSNDHVRLSKVKIGTSAPKKYWIWSKLIGGDGDPELQKKIQQAANRLPGKWNLFNEARIEIAVPKSGKREAGLVYIYLPTQQSSGISAHINAPFFGQMNRKRIDCTVALNNLLLEELAGLIYYAIIDVLQRNPAQAGDMIVDLLSFQEDNDEPSAVLRERLLHILEQQGIECAEWSILPYRDSEGVRNFGAIGEVYRLPEIWDYTIFTQERLSAHIDINLLSDVSKDRLEAVDHLALSICGLRMLPNESDKANWAEQMAEYLLKSQAEIGEWQQFYDELVEFVKHPSHLSGKPILLGQDGKLHFGGDENNDSKVFLSSVQSSDNESSLHVSSSGQIPSFLREKIAYFHPDIRLYTIIDGRRTKSSILDYIRQGSNSLVEEFSVVALLDKVIIAEMPEEQGPIPYGTTKSDQLFEILAWTISLYYNARSPLHSIQDKFARLWLPCVCGWLPATDAYFSSSWDESEHIDYGESLSLYFRAAKYETAKHKQLLAFKDLTPEIRNIGLNKLAYFFLFCGVADYIRVVPAFEDGVVTLSGMSDRFFFPVPESEYFLEAQMTYFKASVESQKPKYSGYFLYKIEDLGNIDGIWAYQTFDNEQKLNFARLAVHSIDKWEDHLKDLRIVKQGGERWSTKIPSLVKTTLINLPWIPTGKESQLSFKKLDQSWYVLTERLRSGSHGYSLIPYVTQSVASLIESGKTLDLFCELGLSRFDFTHAEEGYKLLVELTALYEHKQVPLEMLNYLKGHYKKSWEQVLKLVGENGEKIAQPPTKLLCLNGKSIRMIDLDRPDSRVYIPDDKKLFINLQHNAHVPILLIDNRMEYPDLLEDLYDGQLSLLSELKQSVLVDGTKWMEDQMLDGEQRLIEDERSWLLPFILSVATFREDSQISIGSKRFTEITSALHRARVLFCNDVEVWLENQDGKCLNTKKESIHVSRAHETFFISGKAEENWEELASAVAEYLEIMPIEWNLKYAFSKLHFNLKGNAPDRAQIMQTLRLIKITEENFETVERTLNDNLQWSIDRLLPVMHMFGVVDEINSDQIMDEEEWQKVLIQLLPSEIDVRTLLRIAKESASDSQMGLYLYESFGISLSEWNKALTLTGDNKPAVTNPGLIDDFEELKNAYKETVIAVLRNEVRAGRHTVEIYAENKIRYEAWTMPDSWALLYWSLPERLFTEDLREILHSMQIDVLVFDVFEKQNSLIAIVAGLSGLIGDLAVSVYDISRTNHKFVKGSINQLIAAFISFFLKERAEPPANLLTTEQTIYNRILEESREEELELQIWDEREVYAFLYGKSNFLVLTAGLPEGALTVSTLDELLITLDLQKNDLEHAEEKLEQLKSDRSRARRTVKINGKDFVADEDNYHYLGRLLESIDIDKDAIHGAIDRPLSLKKILQGTSGKHGGANKAPSFKSQRVHRQVEEAVGLAGEIFVHRYLTNLYPNAYTPECWKSENSRYEFPGKPSNDWLGYDFEIRMNKKIYHIEVKTTTGSDPQFELGSSEQRMAIEDASKRNTEFVILFVTEVFERTSLHWLPNPYSAKGKELFSIKEAGARISFRF